MDQHTFWKIIQEAHDTSGSDMDRKCDLLRKAIAELSKTDALAFGSLFDDAIHAAYNWQLWGAAYVIRGGCGDDTFSDFCSSLVSRGQQAFERALANPDALADEHFDEEIWFYEGVEYAVTNGVEAAAKKREHKRLPDRPSGTEWDENAVNGLYPRLHAKFG